MEVVERLAKAAAMRFIVPGDDEWPDGLDDLRHAESIQRRGGEPLGGPNELEYGVLAELAIVLVNRAQLGQPGPPR
jgi:DNA processing protein